MTVTAVSDSPVIGGVDTGAVAEDTGTLAGYVSDSDSLTISDPDAGESAFVVGTITGAYGELSIDAAGGWTYMADNSQLAIQQLDAGESLVDTLTVTTADGTSHDITITINGAEDAPVITGNTSGTVSEDGAIVANGTLSITDVDSSDNPVTFNDLGPTLGDSGYGSFEINAGSWSYTLNNANPAIQALGVGETLTDSFSFIATDGSTRVVTVTISGAVDIPAGYDNDPWPITETPRPDVVYDTEDEAEPVELPILLDQAESAYRPPGVNTSGASVATLPPMDSVVIENVVAEVQQATVIPAEKNEVGNGVRPKFLDLRNLDIAPFEMESVAPLELLSQLDNKAFLDGMEQMNRDLELAVEEQQAQNQFSVEFFVGVTLSLSAGFVSWVLRIGSLLASFMSVMPLWMQLDPLPVLGTAAQKRRKDEASENDRVEGKDDRVEEIFKQGGSA